MEEVRFGNISESTWQLLNEKFQNSSTDLSLEKVLNTTYVVGYRETAEQINVQICNTLPVKDGKYLISYSKDIINGEEKEYGSAENLMKIKQIYQMF